MRLPTTPAFFLTRTSPSIEGKQSVILRSNGRLATASPLVSSNTVQLNFSAGGYIPSETGGYIQRRRDGSPRRFDAVDKREKNAPDKFIATKYVNDDPTRGIAFQRPLCPFPRIAKYKGSGSTTSAASFACVKPDHDDDNDHQGQDSQASNN